MGWLLHFAFRRLSSQWRSLVTMFVGVLLAAIIGANAPLYTSAILQVGMIQYLERQPAADVQIYARTGLTPKNTDDFSGDWARFNANFIEQADVTFSRYGDWLKQITEWAESASMSVFVGDERLEQVNAQLAYYQQIADYIEVVEGRLPSSDTGDAVEVFAHRQFLSQANLSVGDTVTLLQEGWDSSQPISVVIVGSVDEKNDEDTYWFGESPLRVVRGGRGDITANFLTTQPQFSAVVPEAMPDPVVRLGWRMQFDHPALPFANLNNALESVQGFENQLNRSYESILTASNGFVYLTDLPQIFGNYSADSDLLNIPFGLLMIQLGALVLFFLVVIAALVRRSERREISMLQSRGAYDYQIFLLRGIEAFVICVVMALVAPFVARQILVILIPLFTGIEQVPLPLTPSVFLYAFGSVTIAFMILMLTLPAVLRLPLISAGGTASRSGVTTWWQRYYLDVILLIVGLVALVQLTQTRSLAVQSGADGRTQADPLLLLAPTLLFIAFSSVLLRFFPGVMNVVARSLARRRGAVGALASWQVSREPLHYGRIAFLLALAIGIGWFAISYQSTLLGNRFDLASYAVGSDIRITPDNREETNIDDLIVSLSTHPDVADAVGVNRIALQNMVASTGASSGRRGREAGTILAIDSEALSDVAYTRDDYPMPELVQLVSADTVSGQPIPEGATEISVWLRLDQPRFISFSEFSVEAYPAPTVLADTGLVVAYFERAGGYTYQMVLEPERDELDAYQDALIAEQEANQPDEEPSQPVNPDTVEPPDFNWPNGGWVRYTADLTDLPTGDGVLHFSGFNVTFQTFQSFQQTATQYLSFADIEVALDDDLQSVNWLDELESWDLVPARAVRNTELIPTDELADDDLSALGRSGLHVRYSINDDLPTFDLLVNAVTTPTIQFGASSVDDDDIVGVPVHVSQRFAELNELVLGQRFRLSLGQINVWFEVAGIADLFVTLYPDQSYMLVDRTTFAYSLRRTNTIDVEPNEIWVRLNDATRAEDLLNDDMLMSVNQSAIMTIDQQIQTYETDILSLGVIGLLYLSFLIGLVLSLVSLFTYIGLSVQSRISEFAVLRAMGLTGRGLVASIMIEQALVLCTAIVLGALIGQFLTTQVLPPLALNAAGGVVTPPLIVKTSLALIAQYGLMLVGVLALVMVISYYWVRRAATAQALRLTEE